MWSFINQVHWLMAISNVKIKPVIVAKIQENVIYNFIISIVKTWTTSTTRQKHKTRTEKDTYISLKKSTKWQMSASKLMRFNPDTVVLWVKHSTLWTYYLHSNGTLNVLYWNISCSTKASILLSANMKWMRPVTVTGVHALWLAFLLFWRLCTLNTRRLRWRGPHLFVVFFSADLLLT